MTDESIQQEAIAEEAQEYYGTKRIRAWREHSHTAQAADGNDCFEPGYAIVYADGYRSWSPKSVFEAAYQPLHQMNFGHAMQAMHDGHAVRRKGWNGPDAFIVLMPALYLPPYNTQGTARKVNDRTAKWIGEDKPLDCQPYFAMYTQDELWVPGWVPSQIDMLANDWQIVTIDK